MEWREILLVIREAVEIEPLVDQVAQLIEPDRGHVTCFSMVAEPIFPASVGVELPAQIIAEQMDRARAEAQDLQRKAADHLERRGLRSSAVLRSAPVGYQERLLAMMGRHADLVVVGQVQPDEDHALVSRMIEATFMSTGRPSLVVPYVAKEARPFSTVLVGWDGGREASRAIHDALPALKKAEKVNLVVIDPHKLGDQVGEEPGADIGRHLAHHDIKIEVTSLNSGGLSAGDVLLSHAADRGADLLVMGGYGHARLREVVLGGTTRTLLNHMTLPVLLAH